MNQKQSKRIRQLCKKYGIPKRQYRELKNHYKSLNVKQKDRFISDFDAMFKMMQGD